MGNIVAFRFEEIGSVTLKFLENDYIFSLKNIRYIPSLNRNLITMGFR